MERAALSRPALILPRANFLRASVGRANRRTSATLRQNFQAGALPASMAFTRGSTANDSVGSTLTSFATDAPRITSSGLLMEGAATNLTLRSSSVCNAGSWSAPAVFTLNTAEVLAPDGTQTATKFAATGAGDSSFQNHPVTASTVYTWSIYVRLGTMVAADYKFAAYNNTSLAFISTDIVPNVTPTSGGWVRLSYTLTTPVGCTSLRMYAYRNSAGPAASVYLWGAQLETGPIATSYVATGAATAARSVDSLLISGANFTSIFGAGAPSGWFIGDFNLLGLPGSGNFAYLCDLSDGSGSNAIRLLTESNGLVGINSVAATVGATNVQAAGTIGGSVTHRAGMRWNASQLTICLNGATPVSGARTVPALSQLNLGNRVDGVRPLNGRILNAFAGPGNPADAAFQAACVLGADVEAII